MKSKKIKVYAYGSMQWTWFEPLHSELKDLGIEMTNNLDEADVLVAKSWRWKSLLKCRWLLRKKKFFIWYDECNSLNASTERTQKSNMFLPKIELMVPENGEIYQTISTIFGWACCRNPRQIGIPQKKHPKKIVSMLKMKGRITENSFQLRPDKNDLQGVRLHIAKTAYEMGLGHIYGPEWPDGMCQDDSRSNSGDSWHDLKLPICDQYGFTLAIENTLLPYYVSEKIWDAIQCDTVPIYYGNDWIYSEFPKNSFVDALDFSSAQELLRFCAAMTEEEKNERKAKCLNVYSRLILNDQFNKSDQKLALRTATRLFEMCGAKLSVLPSEKHDR
jgi:hypothetical protein